MSLQLTSPSVSGPAASANGHAPKPEPGSDLRSLCLLLRCSRRHGVSVSVSLLLRLVQNDSRALEAAREAVIALKAASPRPTRKLDVPSGLADRLERISRRLSVPSEALVSAAIYCAIDRWEKEKQL